MDAGQRSHRTDEEGTTLSRAPPRFSRIRDQLRAREGALRTASEGPCRVCGSHAQGLCAACHRPICPLHGERAQEAFYCNECIRRLRHPDLRG